MAKQTKTTSKVVANTTIGGTPAIAAASLVGKVVAPQVKKIDEELLQAAGDVQAEQVVAVDAAPASVGFELAQAAGAAAGSAGAGAGAAGMSIGTIAAIGAGVAVAANASKSSSSTAAATTTTTTTTTTTPAAVAGQTFTLTTGADKGAAFTGAATDDTFTAALLTLNAGDELDGGAGTDTLNAEINADIGATTKLTSIENVNITGYGARAIDLTGVTGAKTLTAKLSTGAITLNNNNDATMALGFEGGLTNSITSNYKAGALDGANDTLNLKLNGATAVTAVGTAGFEKVAIDNAGTSSLTAVTAPGVDTATVTGTGALNIAATLDGMKTLTATAFTGSLRTGTVDATTGLPSTTFTGNTAGSTVLLGSGDDVFGYAQGAGTATGTLKAGAGNDTIVLNAASTGGAFVFGEAGDDKIRVVTSNLTTDDVIDGGDGNDTVNIAVGNANSLVLKSVENLTLTSAATGVNTITASDKPLAVTASVNGTDVKLADLVAGSTVNVVTETGATTKTALAVSVGYKAAEAASTIKVDSGMTGALTINNVTDATVNFGAASALGTTAITTTAVTNLTLNATGKLSQTAAGAGAIATTDNKMAKLTVVGTDGVELEEVTSTGLTNVSITGVKDVVLGSLATATKLAAVNVASSAGAVTLAAVGATTGTGTLAVDVSGAKAVSVASGAEIASTKLGDVKVVSTSTDSTVGVTVGAIGSTATTVGNITVSGAGNLAVGLIGHATATMASFGTASFTSTAGGIDFGTTAISTTDASGIDVSFNAKTRIDEGTNATTMSDVKNVGGNINATITGAASAALSFTTATSGIVNLNASNTGGLTTLVTEAGTAGAAQVSAITLGNAITGKTNAVTVGGTVDTINITGGTGTDTVAFSTANKFKAGTIALGGGSADAVDFTNIASADGSAASKGIAVNLSGTAVDFDAGTANASSLAGFTAAAYDAAAAKAIIASGVSFGVTGAEIITGTAQADYFVAANTGSTFTGAAGNDKITLGAAVDTVVINSVSAATDGTDTITGFSIAGLDTFKIVDGGASLLGTATKGFAKGTAAALGAVDLSAANVLVFTDAVTQTGTGVQAAFKTASDAAKAVNVAFEGGNGVFIVTAGATGDATVWYDAAVAAGDSVKVATLTGIALADLANFTTNNFLIA